MTIFCIAATFVNIKSCNSQRPTVIRTDKVKVYKDTIRQIETRYKPIYQRIAVSQEPDTFIRYILRTDTVKGNIDSFIAVEVIKGRECLEVAEWKDSILYDDSIQLWTLNKAVEDCTKAYRKKERIGKIKNFGLFGLLTIFGISLIK